MIEDRRAARHGRPAALRHAGGPGRPRPVLPPPRRRCPQGARPVLRRRHQASSPTSSTPTSPRPSWPWTSRTTPSPRRRSSKAPKDAAEDPRFHYLLARAFSAEDRAGSDKELAEALKINPRHVDSLLLQADHLIDSERYAEAAQGPQAGPRGQSARAAGLGLPGGAGPPRGTTATGEAAARQVGPGALGRRTPRSTTSSAASSRRSTASPRGRPTRSGRSSSTPTTCPPRSSSARTCCGSATRPRAGSSPTRSSPRMAITWSPTT